MYSFANKTPFTPSVILCRIQYFKMIVFMRSRNLQRRLEYRQCPFDQRGRFTVRFIGMRSQLKTNALRYLLHQLLSLV